jgi:hypothetical protein
MYQGHDDRCPICRAERSGISIASNGPRPFGVPVHERSAPDVSLHDFFMPAHGGDDDGGGIHYVSVIARPGTDDVFGSIEEMLDASRASRGISRARTHGVPAALGRNLRALVDAMNPLAPNEVAANAAGAEVLRMVEAMHADEGIASALQGLRDPSTMSIASFVDRVNVTRPAAQTGRQGRPRASNAAMRRVR